MKGIVKLIISVFFLLSFQGQMTVAKNWIEQMNEDMEKNMKKMQEELEQSMKKMNDDMKKMEEEMAANFKRQEEEFNAIVKNMDEQLKQGKIIRDDGTNLPSTTFGQKQKSLSISVYNGVMRSKIGGMDNSGRPYDVEEYSRIRDNKLELSTRAYDQVNRRYVVRRVTLDLDDLDAKPVVVGRI